MRDKAKKIRRYRLQWSKFFRSKVINWLIEKSEYTKYLELGVDNSKNFNKIRCNEKVGVDPAVGRYSYSNPTFKMTSDEFFEQNDEKFDIVFCDGLHESKQVYKDIVNSLECLRGGGVIVCHDMNPLEEINQQVPRDGQRTWNGDCWKALVQLRMERDDLEMCVIDADFGLGVIQRGSQKKLEDAELTYDNFDKNREEWLNLISEKEFFDKWVMG